jgi:hypothetical protein
VNAKDYKLPTAGVGICLLRPRVAWDQLTFSAHLLFMPIIPQRFYKIISSYTCRCILGRAPSGLRRQIPTPAEKAGIISHRKIRFLEKESAYHPISTGKPAGFGGMEKSISNLCTLTANGCCQ